MIMEGTEPTGPERMTQNYMIDIELEFFDTIHNFLRSSEELRDAAALCDDDPVKQEMVSFVAPDFNKMWARSEGIKVMIKTDYSKNKEFIMEEMKIITHKNLEIAEKIKNRLGPLTTDEKFN